MSPALYGQVDSLNSVPGPKEGINKLALQFLKINFTAAQRELLEDVTLEFIFYVDSIGKATLEDVNGINDKAIFDSLYYTTEQLPAFNPMQVNGRTEGSIYSMILEYPTYTGPTSRQYGPPNLEDFEEMVTGGRTDCLIGAVFNGPVGNMNEYLGLGGGMKVDLLFTGKRGYGGGIFMNAYFNDLEKDYPINTNRTQNGSQPILLLGLALNKLIPLNERRELMAQFEAGYAIQNISSRTNSNDPDYIQLQGFSPGFTLHYAMKIGHDRLSGYYLQPAIVNNYVNFHLGIHPIFFDLDSGSGMLWDIGVSYRLSYKVIRSYKLRE
ncbi:MAG TPA: hypothetical protein VK589_16400 [Chryseolinea sp.]|nr:hypothetical protein [Chryseolinea sp.]